MSDEADKLSLKDYGIQNDSTLLMVGRLRGGLIIDVRIILQNQEEIKQNIDSEQTVIKLKEMIFLRSSILSEDQMSLTFAGVVLKN